MNKPLNWTLVGLSFLAALTVSTAARAEDAGHSPVVAKVSAGLGAESGGFGGNLELGIPYLVAQAGYGTNVFVGASWAVGAKAYVLDTTHKLRPHVGFIYGNPAVYDVTVVDQRSGGMSIDAKGTVHAWGIFAGVEYDIGAPAGFVLSAAGGVLLPDRLPSEVTAAIDSVGARVPWGPSAKLAFSIGYRIGGPKPRVAPVAPAEGPASVPVAPPAPPPGAQSAPPGAQSASQEASEGAVSLPYGPAVPSAALPAPTSVATTAPVPAPGVPNRIPSGSSDANLDRGVLLPTALGQPAGSITISTYDVLANSVTFRPNELVQTTFLGLVVPNGGMAFQSLKFLAVRGPRLHLAVFGAAGVVRTASTVQSRWTALVSGGMATSVCLDSDCGFLASGSAHVLAAPGETGAPLAYGASLIARATSWFKVVAEVADGVVLGTDDRMPGVILMGALRFTHRGFAGDLGAGRPLGLVNYRGPAALPFISASYRI